MKNIFRQLIGPLGIVTLSIIIVTLWFWRGLLFAGAEEGLLFYNYSKSLSLFFHIWYAVGTGFPVLVAVSRIPYFLILEPLYRIGFSSVLLEAITFSILILTGTLSVFFLVRETVSSDLKDEWKRLVPFLASLFYFFNPFSTTQIWGRGLSYQFFAFALIPLFLLFFILSIQRKNLLFVYLGAVISFFLSSAYNSPAVVITTWVSIGTYFIFYIIFNRSDTQNIYSALFSLILLFVSWTLINFFWIYPTIQHGKEMLNYTLTTQENIISLKGLAPNSHFLNIIRLIHREYYDGTFGKFSGHPLIILLSWLLPLIFILAIPTLKKSKHFAFYLWLFLISFFVTTGANVPTGWMLIWLFERFPLLQVLRNPYEKFGIVLILSVSPLFAIGLLTLSYKLASFYRTQKLKYFFIFLFSFLLFVILVWPIWKGNFAGGIRSTFWVEVPTYYEEVNKWLNSQEGDFYILHLPLQPEDGVTYTWEYPYEGIEPSEFLFDKGSIARNFGINKNYYSVLLDRFGANTEYKKLPYWSDDYKDFEDDDLYKELGKLNVRFIVLHFDTDYKKRKAISPEETRIFLENQKNIKKINNFGKLEIYKVDIPSDIDLIYSPNMKVNFIKIDTSNYLVDVKNAKQQTNIYFLQQFHPGWKAFINGEEIKTHSEVFSYANKWTINKMGDFQITIKFIQQDSVHRGAIITSLTLGVLIIIILLTYLRGSFSFK